MPDKDQFFEIAQEHSELVSNYKECFTSPAGVKVLKDLEAAYGNRLSFNSDPYQTAFREGQRSMVLRVLTMIKDRKDN